MIFSELTRNSTHIKKALGLKRIRQTWHNSHRDGSGNFGYVLVAYSNKGFNGEKWFLLHGHYGANGEVERLDFGDYAQAATFLIDNNDNITVETIIEKIKKGMNA